MHKDTRFLFAAYVSQIALVNGITAADAMDSKFTVAPHPEQKLEEAIKESSEFLKSIAIVPVINQSGEKVGIGTTRTLAAYRKRISDEETWAASGIAPATINTANQLFAFLQEEPDAAQRVALDDGGLEAQLAGADGGHIPARARADDDDVEIHDLLLSQTIIVMGSSIRALKACSQRAPVAPSTTR